MRPAVAAISQNSVALQGTQKRTPTIPRVGALPRFSVAFSLCRASLALAPLVSQCG